MDAYEILLKVIMALGGLGLFLIGMKNMGEGLELAAGSKLRTLLEKITSNKFIAMLVGVLVTGVIQSSSATDAMVVGFANAGLMNLSQAIGVLFGAKIGTTVTSLLLAIDIKAFVPIFIFLGAVIITFFKKNNYKYYGQIAAGFGMLFLGLSLMSQNLKWMGESEAFLSIADKLSFPLLGLIVGVVFTGIIQSSSASVGILMALATAGVITNLDQAVYVVFGFNVGACSAALLSSLGANRTAKQIAFSNLLISCIGAVIMTVVTIFLPFTGAIDYFLPAEKVGVAAQISAAHILFNIAITVILLPCSNLIIKLTNLIMPVKEDEEDEVTVYLDSRILTTPPMAVQQTEKECARLASLARASFDLALEAVLNKNAKAIERLKDNESTVDKLTHGITKYIVKINGLDIIDYDRKVMGAMYNAIQDLERIGDRSENICESAQELIDGHAEFSDVAKEELKNVCDLVSDILDNSFYLFSNQSKDQELIEKVIQTEEMIDELTDRYRLNHIARLSRGECSAESGAVFLELLTNLERVGDHAVTVAFCIPYKRPQQQVVTT